MTNKPINKLKPISIKVILAIVISFVSLISIGVIYEQINRLKSVDKFQPDGEFISVNQHKLHYLKKGDGGPTIIFESGLDPGGHLPWYKVQDEYSKSYTTISYDRAGVLWSERGNSSKSCEEISNELTQLLEKTNCPKPYIVVGHSLAGLFLRDFIIKNKQDIIGVVFVDVSHPEQDDRKSNALKALSKPTSPWVIKFASASGLLHLFYNNTYPTTNRDDQINQIVRSMFYKGIDTFTEEQKSVKSMLIDSKKIQSFDSIPLKIITGYSPDRYNKIGDMNLSDEFFDYKMELQKDLLKLSTKSEQILARKSGHYIQLEEPEIIINAINSIVLNNKNMP